MTLGKENYGVAGNCHCSELFLSVGCLRVVQKIELCNLLLNLMFEIKHPHLVNLSVQSRMPGCALLHKFSKEAGFIRSAPLIRHVRKNSLALSLPLPEGNHLLCIGFDILSADCVPLKFAAVQYLQILHRMTCELRESRHCFWLWPTLANNQLIVPNIYGFLFTNLHEVERPEYRNRVLAPVLLIKLSLNKRPLN